MECGYDIYKVAKPITDIMERVDLVKYDFEKCESPDSAEQVHPVFREILKVMRGDYT